MKLQLQQVADFMDRMEQTRPATPKVDPNTACLRINLILEEALELAESLGVRVEARTPTGTCDVFPHNGLQCLPKAPSHPNLVHALDAIVDLLYVTLGAAHAIGAADVLETAFNRVHVSNMAKMGGPLREDGKQLKPPGWQPADLSDLVHPHLEGKVLTQEEIDYLLGQGGRHGK